MSSAAFPAIWTLLAADMVGAAEWQLQTTAEYAKVRTQFDRPIGFFQAVKHPIVNMMNDDELQQFLSNIHGAVQNLVSQLPEHQRFIDHYCKAS